MPKIRYTNKTTTNVSQSIGIAESNASIITLSALIDVMVLSGLNILINLSDFKFIDYPSTK